MTTLAPRNNRPAPASTSQTRDAVGSALLLQALLQNSLGSAYRIERELTGAGMSHVFLADETALGRKVVMKVVGAQCLSGLSAQRFQEEIRLSASLQQANIIPVFAAGVAAGIPYYTMPLVPERSLLERLKREGRLPLRDAVGILRDIARALAYAHAHGVVHRDIKPGNVLLSGGTAIVTDFGIARALDVALESGETNGECVSAFGSGTPAYMAPEQALGDPKADHRVDIYSFGCVAYAVLAGAAPFDGLPTHLTILAHLMKAPTPLDVVRPEVPHRIAALVARCLEKDPAKRPQKATELLDELDAETEKQTLPAGAMRVAFAVAAWTMAALVLLSMAT